MMFGHSDDDQQHQEHNNGPLPDGALSSDNTVMPTAAPALPNDDDAASDFIMTDAPQPPHHDSDMPVVVHDNSPDHDEPATPERPKSHMSEELLRIKQEAIQELAPMVDHLDQTPEEKFRTTMMMIQATDNDQLIPAAYAAAKAIPDEKARAQAYLDIVNEINYFTQTDFDKAA